MYFVIVLVGCFNVQYTFLYISYTKLLPFTHAILFNLAGDRQLGRCFVNTNGDSELTLSQELYVTEFCLDQAKNTNCGKLWPNNCSHGENYCIHDNEASKWDGGNYSKALHIPTLWTYRYQLWFLFLFIIARALPNITWRLFCGADIRKGIRGVATVAEFEHALLGGETLATTMYKDEHQTGIPSYLTWWTTWMTQMREIGLKEVMERATGKLLYRLYVLRKVTDILIDCALLSALLLLISHHDVFPLSTFVCDLHNDTNNLFQCSTIPQRYVPCTVSFGTEFMICSYAMMIAYALDCIIQLIALLSFTKIIPRLRRKRLSEDQTGNQEERNEQEPLFLDLLLFRELALDKNDFHREYRALMHSPNELYLVGMLYKQSNITHGHFLQMISQKILEHLRYVFDHLKRDPVDQEHGKQQAAIAVPVAHEDNVRKESISYPECISCSSSHSLLSDSGRVSENVRDASGEVQKWQGKYV